MSLVSNCPLDREVYEVMDKVQRAKMSLKALRVRKSLGENNRSTLKRLMWSMPCNPSGSTDQRESLSIALIAQARRVSRLMVLLHKAYAQARLSHNSHAQIVSVLQVWLRLVLHSRL
jgi:hypothetical protein